MTEIITIPANSNAELVAYLSNGETYRIGANDNGVILVDWSNVVAGDSFTIDWKPVFQGKQTAIYAYDEPRTNFTPGGYSVQAFRNTERVEFVEPIGNDGTMEDLEESQDGIFTGDGSPGTGLFGFSPAGLAVGILAAIVAAIINERLRK